jgi:hypothetical protein
MRIHLWKAEVNAPGYNPEGHDPGFCGMGFQPMFGQSTTPSHGAIASLLHRETRRD